MKLREQDRHFLWSLMVAVGMIFTWKGLWEGLYHIPYLGDPWVALFVGLAMLTFSGLIFKEFDPLGGLEKSVNKNLKRIQHHPKKDEFRIKYYDKSRKKHFVLEAKDLLGMEQTSLVFRKGKDEIFIPVHRLTEVTYQGKTQWRL